MSEQKEWITTRREPKPKTVQLKLDGTKHQVFCTVCGKAENKDYLTAGRLTKAEIEQFTKLHRHPKSKR